MRVIHSNKHEHKSKTIRKATGEYDKEDATLAAYTTHGDVGMVLLLFAFQMNYHLQ